MVERIQPRSTWSRVRSSSPVKKIDRRSDHHPEKKFREHLSKKSASEEQEENTGSDSPAGDATAVAKKEKDTPGSPAKPGKRIDIII